MTQTSTSVRLPFTDSDAAHPPKEGSYSTQCKSAQLKESCPLPHRSWFFIMLVPEVGLKPTATRLKA